MSTAILEKSVAADQNAPQTPDMPKPVREHEWLAKFSGEWTWEGEAFCQPGQPPMQFSGRDTARMIGGFWLVSQGKGDCPEMPFESVLTLGYDPNKAKYVGSWMDSMTSWLWKYEGEVNTEGNILTLETEGPCPGKPGALAKYREITEFKSPDHRVFTSSTQKENGEWSTIVTIRFHQK